MSRRQAHATFNSPAQAPLMLTLAVAAAAVSGSSVWSQGLGAGPPIEVWYGEIDPPIVAQRDITVREVTSIHPLDPEPLPLECSGMAALGDRLLLTSDRHSHVIFTVEVDLDGSTIDISLPEPQQVIDAERRLLDDAECVTLRRRGQDAWDAYIFCSLSNDPAGERRFKRQHLARMRLDADGRIAENSVQVLSGDTIRDALSAHFEALNVPPYESFLVDRDENTLRWGNVEGVAWAPDGVTLLGGMRNPVAGEDAIFFALSGVDDAFDAADPSRIAVQDVFRLNLHGRGVTDLAWDPMTGGYLIGGARSNGPKLSPDQVYPLENLDSALFWWSGDKLEEPVLIAKFPDLNIEALTRVGESQFLALGSDEGDVSEGRSGRQSVITLMYFMDPLGRDR